MKSYPIRLLDSLIINDFGSSQCLRFFVEREPETTTFRWAW